MRVIHTADAAPLGSPLLPLAVALLAWLTCAGVLDLLASRQGSLATAGLLAVLSSAWHLLAPLLAGLCFQGSTERQAPAARLWKAVLLWSIWTAISAALLLIPPQFGLDAPWSIAIALLQQLGLVIGLAAGWFASSSLRDRVDLRLAVFRPLTKALATGITLAIILLPFAPETPLLHLDDGWRAGSAPAYGKAVLTQIYVLLKALILWVPLGMLFAFARRQERLAAWAAAGLLAFLIVGPVLLFSVFRITELLEIAGAYWGIAFGAWLGASALQSTPEAAAAPGAAGSSARANVNGPSRVAASAPSPRGFVAAVARRFAAASILIASAAWAWSFPRWDLWLLSGLVLYVLLLGKFRHAWLLVVPAALPLLNLAPGTGRFFFDEFDLLMLATVAMALWHGPEPLPRIRFSVPFVVALGIFALSYAVSLAIGTFPLAPLDANAFTSYWSTYNGLRVAKGLAWALPLAAMLCWTVRLNRSQLMQLLLPGMLIGLAGVIGVGLWERWLFADLFDLSVRYRITATFGSMHTGGSEIEIYLAMALPFAWLAVWKGNPLATRLVGLVLLALGAYLMALTIARGGILALGVVFIILALSSWRAQAGEVRGWVLAAAALVVSVVVLTVGLAGGYLQARFTSVEQDWATRSAHWATALKIRDDDMMTTLFGMGLGRFPAAYLYRSGAPSLPGTYRFANENGESFLRLGGGETLYMAQRVAVTAGQRYTLTLRMRSTDANARLGVPTCEKHLLDSFRCQWRVLAVPSDGAWHKHSIVVDSGSVGSGNWLTRRPVELFVFNDTPGTTIDVADVQLQDPSGAMLIRNADFSAGGDYWFFKTHSHLPWHIKNLLVSLLFEQGWFGLIGFVVLLVAVVPALARALWRGDRLAGALLAAVGGFLTVSVVGSPFDAPRIALLFFLLLVLGDSAVRAPTVGLSADRSGGVLRGDQGITGNR